MYINYYLYSSGRRRTLQVARATPNKTKRCLPGRHLMRLSTPGIMARRVYQGNPRRSSGWGFSLISPPRKSCCLLKKNKTIWIFICYVSFGPYSFYCNVFGLHLFVELIVFQFHPFTIDICIRFGPYSFNCSVSGLESFIKFFFQFHPFALGFYIRFGSHSFNCDVFGLESFIELICL
jgi:hypothetical protein